MILTNSGLPSHDIELILGNLSFSSVGVRDWFLIVNTKTGEVIQYSLPGIPLDQRSEVQLVDIGLHYASRFLRSTNNGLSIHAMH